MSESIYLFIAQAVGFISMAVGIWANKQVIDKRLIGGNVLASLICTLHFVMLGAHLGAILQLTNVARFGLSHTHRYKFVGVIFATIALAQGLFMAQSAAMWLTISASMIGSIALFSTAGLTLRKWLALATLCNLAYSIEIVSISSIVFQVMSLTALLHQLMDNKMPRYIMALGKVNRVRYS